MLKRRRINKRMNSWGENENDVIRGSGIVAYFRGREDFCHFIYVY